MMFRHQIVIVVSLAVLVYSVVITVRLLSLERPSDSIPQQQLRQEKCVPPPPSIPPWEQHLDFTDFDNETGTPDGHFIVPNYVHFIKFGQADFSFVDAVCVLSAFKNQKPEKIFFHTDADGFHGKYWDVITNTTGLLEVLIIRKMEMPIAVFGQKFNKAWQYYHAGDVARILVLMEFGGIYLDRDVFVVRKLDDLRRFEMSIGWRFGRELGNQVLVAHKDARFLKLWYESYKNYKRDCFYCNAGMYPVRDFLKPNPQLVHRLERLFGNYGIKEVIYTTKFPTWTDYYTLHTLSRRLRHTLKKLSPPIKYPAVFDEVNVLMYPVAFRDMCKAVYPFPKT